MYGAVALLREAVAYHRQTVVGTKLYLQVFGTPCKAYAFVEHEVARAVALSVVETFGVAVVDKEVVIDSEVFVFQGEGHHVEASDVPNAVYIGVCRCLSACLGVECRLRYDGVLLERSIDTGHDRTLCLGVEVVEANRSIVCECRLKVGVTDYNTQGVGHIGHRLQLIHRRLR